MITGDDRTAKVVIEADTDDYVKNVKKSHEETEKLSKGLDTLTKKMEGLTKRAGNRMILFGAADIAGLSAMSAVAGTLEKQMSTIEGAAANINNNLNGFQKFNVDRTRQAIRETSRELPVSRAEVAQTSTALTKMGITDSTAVNKLTPDFIKMGAATGESSVALARGQTQLSRQMGNMNTNQMERHNDVATGLGAKGGVSASGIMDFASQLSGSARMAGIDQTDLLGISTAFSRSGADGIYASSMFNKMINEITNIQKTGSPEIRKYANALGVSRDRASNMSSMDIFSNVIKQVSNSGERGTVLMENLGFEGARSAKAIQGLASEGGIDKWIAEARKQYRQGDAVEEGSAEAMNGLFDSMALLRNQFTDVAQVIGQTVLPVFTAFADGAAGVMQFFQPFIEAGAKVAGVGGLAMGGAAIAGGAVLKNWAGVSTPALAKRVIGSSYLANFRGGMTTGSQQVSGQHSDNIPLRNYNDGKLGVLQRGFFRVGTGIGAFNEEVTGGKNLHPIRIPTNLALMGVGKGAEFLGKGAGDFYRQAGMSATDITTERKGLFRGMAHNFMTGRRGVSKLFWGDLDNKGMGGQQKEGVDPEEEREKAREARENRSSDRRLKQAQAIKQGVNTQRALDDRTAWHMKQGMSREQAESAARDAVGTQHLDEKEKKAVEKEYKQRVQKTQDVTGVSKKAAEKQVLKEMESKAKADVEANKRERDNAATPMGKLKSEITKLIGAVKILTQALNRNAKARYAEAGGDPDIVGKSDDDYVKDADTSEARQREITERSSAENAEKIKQKADRKERRLAGWGRARDESIGKHLGRTGKQVGKGIGMAATGALGGTMRMGAGVLGAGMGMFGGPVGMGIVGATALGGFAMAEKNRQDDATEKFKSGDAITNVLSSWNAALEKSTGKIYEFTEALDDNQPSSADSEEAFGDFKRAKKGSKKDEYDFAPIELLRDNPMQLERWVKSQKPTGEDADKMASDIIKALGEEEGAIVLKRLSESKGLGDKDSISTMGLESLAAEVDRNWGQTDLSLLDRYRAGIVGADDGEKMNTHWQGGAGVLETSLNNEDSVQAKRLEGVLAEQNRLIGTVEDEYDTGDPNDKTAEVFAYKTVEKTLNTFMKQASESEGGAAALSFIAKKIQGSSLGGGTMLENYQELVDASKAGDQELMDAARDKFLASGSVGKAVEGLSDEEMAQYAEDMKKLEVHSAARNYIEDIDNSDFLSRNKNYDKFSGFAEDVSKDETIDRANTTERSSSKAFVEAAKALQAAAEKQSSDPLVQQSIISTFSDQYAGQRESEYAQYALAQSERQEGLKTSTMNRMGKFNQSQEELKNFVENTDPESKDYAIKLDSKRSTAESGLYSEYQAIMQFERGKDRGEEDYLLSRQYAQEDFQKASERMDADHKKSLKRSEEDFNESIARSQEDFQERRLYSDRDFQRSLRRQVENGMKTVLGGPTARQFAKQTTDSGNLIYNMKEQNSIMEDQKKQVENLKDRGLSQDAIDLLDLGNPENWQQTEELFQTLTADEIKAINRQTGKRSDAYKNLTQDEDMNKELKWAKQDRKRQQKREDKAREKGLDRQRKDYKKSLGRQAEDWSQSLERRLEDWNNSNSRIEKAHRKSVRRMNQDFLGFGDAAGKTLKQVGNKIARFYRGMSKENKKFFKRDARAIEKHIDGIVSGDYFDPNTFQGKSKKKGIGSAKGKASIGVSGEANVGTKKDNFSLAKYLLFGGAAGGIAKATGLADDENARKVLYESPVGGLAKMFGFAEGGIVSQPTKAIIGEAGSKEAVIPLNNQGMSWLSDAMKMSVANKGMTPAEGKQIMSVVNNNNFSGITVVSQDPDNMAKQLKNKARLKALRSGSRTPVG